MGRRRTIAALTLCLLFSTAAAALAVNDPHVSRQWGFEKIRAEQAWGVARGQGAVIAVIDTGVDLEHPDLQGRLFRDSAGRVIGIDYVDNDDDPQDLNGHGTLVAGIAAAATDNGIGIAGTAPGARIMPIRVLDEDGSGFSEDVDAGIRWAVDNGADVINLSLEGAIGGVGVGVGITAPSAAVRYAWDRGVVVVAATGNSSTVSTDYPPSSPIVLVGATDRQDRRAPFSDAGREDAVMAPGVEIVSTWWCDPASPTFAAPASQGGCDGREHTYGQADGTSFSAPFAAGAIAVLRSAGLGHVEAVERLRQTAKDLGDPGPDLQYGYGRIDLAAAVAQPPPPSPSPTPTPSPQPTTGPTPSPQPTAEPSPTAPTEEPGGPDGSPSTEAEPDASPSETTPPVEPDPATDATPDAGNGADGQLPTAAPSTLDETPPPPVDVSAAIGDDSDRRPVLTLLAAGLLVVTAGAVVTTSRSLSERVK